MLKAKLFCGVMYSDFEVYKKVIKDLCKEFGQIQQERNEFDFTFTKYYEKEFGNNLKKRFIAFKEQIDIEVLPEIKLFTVEIENSLREQGRRLINIDPGYITHTKVVVASTKELPHRIYLKKEIFGDLQMILSKNKVITFRHTFADYQANKKFFQELR